MTVLAEIADLAERYPLPAGSPRCSGCPATAGRPANPTCSAAALDRLALPAGAGYGYLLGESRAVVGLRDQLGRLGLARDAVYAKGYWNLNSRPTR